MQINTDPRATPPRADSPLPPAPVPDEPFYRRGEQARRWGGILLLIGVVWLVFALGSRLPVFGVGFVERTEPIPSQSFAVERVVITGVNDNVELVGWNQEEVQVEAVKHGFGWNGEAAQEGLERLEVVITPSGETLTIDVRRPLDSIVGRAPYANLRIALPAGVSAETRLANGDIQVTEVSGDLALSTVSGDLDSTDTRGTLTLSTTSGDLDVRDHSGALTAESVSGDMQLEGALASPSVKTVSGDARLEGASGTVELRSISGGLNVTGGDIAALNVESTSGDVEARIGLREGSNSRISSISGDVGVRLENVANLELEATTTSGEIESDLEGLDEERRSLRGSLGDGSAALSVSTTSGDIEVRGD
jgi:hypothetical protein